MTGDNFAWGGPAIGLIFGSAVDEGYDAGGAGGKNAHQDNDDTDGEGQALFSVGGTGVSLYGGVIGGLGESFGPYVTAGVIVGSDFDIGVGVGGHLGQTIGVGVIFPVVRSISNLARHNDKVGAYVAAAKDMYSSASAYAMDVAASASQGLEALTSMV